MKLISIAHNMTVLELDNGTEILFSYSTPVAGNNNLSGFFVTDELYSRTTTKHINRYLSQYDLKKGAAIISQAAIDQMVTTTTPKAMQ
tara:strand:- start:445 stop:708 length:264 start_codon:yes stop_codon:yes gene_type:complete